MGWSDDFISKEPSVKLVTDFDFAKVELEVKLAKANEEGNKEKVEEIRNQLATLEKIAAEAKNYGLRTAFSAARSCYSGILMDERNSGFDDDEERVKRLAKQTWTARHHTPFMHRSYTFAMDGVSRQLIWSLMHSHPFYNSEQVSQRYKKMVIENVVAPRFHSEKAQEIFQEGVQLAFDTYDYLRDVALYDQVKAEYARIRKLSDKEIEDRSFGKSSEDHRVNIKKKTQEVARYVLPIGTSAHMWHSLNGIVIARLDRLSNQPDCPVEAKHLIGKIVGEVRRVDPDSVDLFSGPIPEAELLENKVRKDYLSGRDQQEMAKDFIKEFDAQLQSDPLIPNQVTRLVDYKPNAMHSMACAVREMLGVSSSVLSDADAIRIVLDPAYNTQRGDILTLSHTQKLSRAANIPALTFMVKLSNTADAQAQRQRMSPATRGLFNEQVHDEPDYITPFLMTKNPKAKQVFENFMERIWDKKNKLIELGESAEAANYLLPNATSVRYRESTDLLNWMQKDEKRRCLNSQEEIWRIAIQQGMQIERVHPETKGYFGPPCTLRFNAGVKPYCPEGDLYCKIPVWVSAMQPSTNPQIEARRKGLAVESMLESRLI